MGFKGTKMIDGHGFFLGLYIYYLLISYGGAVHELLLVYETAINLDE